MKDKPFEYRETASSRTDFPVHTHGKRTSALRHVKRGERLRKRIRVVLTGMIALSVLSAVLE